MPTYEGRTSKSWIPWLILLLVLLAAAAYLLYKNRHALTAAATPTPTVTASSTPTPGLSTAASAPLSDLTGFLATTNPASLNGQTVNFTDVNVISVTGDKTFAVGASNGSEVYVLLSPPLNNRAAEQALQIKVGQKLHVVGTVKTMPALADIEKQWTLKEADAMTAQKFGVYVEASRVDVTKQAQ